MMDSMGMRAAMVAVGVALAIPAAARADEHPPIWRPDPFDFAFSLGIDLGSASMEQFHAGLDAYAEEAARINPDLRFLDDPESRVLLAVSPRFRLYLPRQMLIEVGAGLLQNHGSAALDIGGVAGRLSYRNRAMEVPVLVGVHAPLHDRALIYAAVGPSMLVLNRSSWDLEPGSATDYAGERGGGLEASLGVDWFVHARVSAHLALRYRYAKSGAMTVDGRPLPPVAPVDELDFSGLSVVLGGRWHSR